VEAKQSRARGGKKEMAGDNSELFLAEEVTGKRTGAF
jgi:hypothetical protein